MLNSLQTNKNSNQKVKGKKKKRNLLYRPRHFPPKTDARKRFSNLPSRSPLAYKSVSHTKKRSIRIAVTKTVSVRVRTQLYSNAIESQSNCNLESICLKTKTLNNSK